MSKPITHVQRNVNLRQDVDDLIRGECLIRKNGERGFSLTLNQIVLEFFELRTPKGIALTTLEGKPALTIEDEPVIELAEGGR